MYGEPGALPSRKPSGASHARSHLGRRPDPPVVAADHAPLVSAAEPAAGRWVARLGISRGCHGAREFAATTGIGQRLPRSSWSLSPAINNPGNTLVSVRFSIDRLFGRDNSVGVARCQGEIQRGWSWCARRMSADDPSTRFRFISLKTNKYFLSWCAVLSPSATRATKPEALRAIPL
jgi:hypothetical protein